jgi:hypothetical protein
VHSAPPWRQRLCVPRTRRRARPTTARTHGTIPEFFVTHAGDPLLPADNADVLGYHLTRAQRRYLSSSTWLVAAEGDQALGLAAHQPSQSEVRVVLECLVDRRLSARGRRGITENLVDGMEALAQADGVTLLSVMLERGVSRTPLVRRGFATVAIEPWGTWMQKHFLCPWRNRPIRWVQ